MNWTTVLAGLSETKDFWATIELLQYLLLLAGLNTVAGLYTVNVVEKCEIFSLPRNGYSQWYHRAMLGVSSSVCILLAIITGIACLVSKDSISVVLIAAAVLALNIIVISNIQMFITLLSGSVMPGYLICMLIQLLSLFTSERFPQAVKMLLIGNWGMAVRTTLADPVGVPIGIAITIECLMLFILWIGGWHIIRRYKRGGL